VIVTGDKKPSKRQRLRDAHFRKGFKGAPPQRKPSKPIRPLASMRGRVGYGWPNQRIGLAQLAYRLGFGSVEQAEAYLKSGSSIPLPIHVDCAPHNRRWSLIAVLAYEQWMLS
jgi:hypothetical protein